MAIANQFWRSVGFAAATASYIVTIGLELRYVLFGADESTIAQFGLVSFYFIYLVLGQFVNYRLPTQNHVTAQLMRLH